MISLRADQVRFMNCEPHSYFILAKIPRDIIELPFEMSIPVSIDGIEVEMYVSHFGRYEVDLVSKQSFREV